MSTLQAYQFFFYTPNTIKMRQNDMYLQEISLSKKVLLAPKCTSSKKALWTLLWAMERLQPVCLTAHISAKFVYSPMLAELLVYELRPTATYFPSQLTNSMLYWTCIRYVFYFFPQEETFNRCGKKYLEKYS